MYRQIPWTINENKTPQRKRRTKKEVNNNMSKSVRVKAKRKKKSKKDFVFSLFGWEIIIKD